MCTPWPLIYLRRSGLLLDRRVSGLRGVLRPAGEDDEVRAVLFQAGNVGGERLLLPSKYVIVCNPGDEEGGVML